MWLILAPKFGTRIRLAALPLLAVARLRLVAAPCAANPGTRI
ncbi:hypothetical protein DW66_4251 [Pseudomonas putida]|nr:hypothetical protein DW66_4251 [Pseudomonas putida]